MTQQVLILQGLPASGKSTYAKQRVGKDSRWKRVNKDDLRRMIDNSHWSKENERHILSIRDQLITHYLLAGYDVIVDDTNFVPKHTQHITELVKSLAGLDVVIETKLFNVDPKECIKRNELRAEHERVPEKVIWDMYNKFVRPNEYIDQTPYTGYDPTLPNAIICDLDGTLALLDDRSPYNCEEAGGDRVNLAVHGVLAAMCDMYKPLYVIFVSGRNERCRAATESWLEAIGWVVGDGLNYLFMRDDYDTRKDPIVKLDLFNKHVRGKFNVKFVLDDRDQVVEMWRKTLGLTCLQVNYGAF
jgi:predicted kinase